MTWMIRMMSKLKYKNILSQPLCINIPFMMELFCYWQCKIIYMLVQCNSYIKSVSQIQNLPQIQVDLIMEVLRCLIANIKQSCIHKQSCTMQNQHTDVKYCLFLFFYFFKLFNIGIFKNCMYAFFHDSSF